MSDKSQSNRLRATKSSVQFRAFRRRVTMEPIVARNCQSATEAERVAAHYLFGSQPGI
jgi:hypothetical protein